ncbi:glycerol-3-phosphate acyltransferase [Croceicoccus estronivorus]|uniref:glycerol-3-phosphate 1-O-acyltransferase PlsY n=1 Tax=Croceicoccus estronivorus TaxID=1172626 RepID=UPI00082C584E|nr:glycerol-3-phosphate 1-O-acyltransferase PlsY [Croceicoccus estronivorus]OCC24837.1 glycerol-3-phosphate acyltransferase [Croceicoccus estronivorus]
MQFLTETGVAVVLGYVLGSIPFGLLLTRLAGLGDVRKIGSGNIGATNVLRTGHKGLAAATLLLDLAKGFLPVFAAGYWWGPMAAGGTALGAVIGHCFPVWLKFKGGKGVATMAGVCFGLGWPIGLVYALMWLGMLALTRISSIAGMSAAVAAPIAAYVLGYETIFIFLIAIAALVIWLHGANIGRLMNGTEPKVGGGKKE